MFILAMAHVISSTPSLGAKVRSTDDRAQFAGALFKFETLSRVLAENENMSLVLTSELFSSWFIIRDILKIFLHTY